MESVLMEVIAQVGFPIAACIYMVYHYNKLVTDTNQRNQEREAILQKAIDKANDTNTILLQTNLELTRSLPEINEKLDTIMKRQVDKH